MVSLAPAVSAARTAIPSIAAESIKNATIRREESLVEVTIQVPATADLQAIENSLDEIAEAVKAIKGDYAKHSRAARGLAREIFEAEDVLKSILNRVGI